MKIRWVLPAVMGVATALTGAVWWWRMVPPSLPAPGPSAEAPTRTQADPPEVFQKAFWKRPEATDKILHAERREWDGPDGIKKWEWFLVVEPSPALLKHLREDNAFNLAPAPPAPPARPSPAWFRYDPADFEALGSARNGMFLLFGKTRSILYATSHGGGFRAGAAEPAPPAPTSFTAAGRLPPTSPPNPRNP